MLWRRFYSVLTLSLCAGLLSLFALTPPVQARALASPIQVTARTYTVHFPASIDFYATVSDSSSTLFRASIFLTIGPDKNQELQTFNLQPNHVDKIHWHEDTEGNRFLPPGTPISYYWQIFDKAGNTFTDTTQQFTTVDTRFNWQHLQLGLLQVNWYNRSQDFGQVMLNQASSSVRRISAKIGGSLIQSINLWVYASNDDFHGSLAPGSYEWVGGEARPALNEASISVADTSDDTLIRDMPHELTHLLFHQQIENGIYSPTWFDEGLAVYNQLYHEPDMSYRFQQALKSQSLLRLDDLSMGFPSDADKAYLAYAQSWNLVSYMFTTFGQKKVASLIHLMNNPVQDFGTDLQQSMGMDQLHLENQWRLSLHQPGVISADLLTPTPTPAPAPHIQPVRASISSGTILWIVFGGGALLLLGIVAVVLAAASYERRNRVAAQTSPQAQNPMYWQQNHQSPHTPQAPYTYMNPSQYMRNSMYAQPEPPPQDAQPALPAAPPVPSPTAAQPYPGSQDGPYGQSPLSSGEMPERREYVNTPQQWSGQQQAPQD